MSNTDLKQQGSKRRRNSGGEGFTFCLFWVCCLCLVLGYDKHKAQRHNKQQRRSSIWSVLVGWAAYGRRTMTHRCTSSTIRKYIRYVQSVAYVRGVSVDPNPSQSRIIGTQSEQASHFPFTFLRSHAGRATQNVIAKCTILE